MADLAPGTLVARRFVLDRLLGEGGMGVVWAATHTVTRKTVALKMLKPERAGDPVVRQRFVREARAASLVRHPNIIEIHDVIELDDGAPAMVMDLLDGESLGARLEREGTVPLEALAPIMVQVLSAVGTAHAGGVVHRDLKPDNIFLVGDPGAPSVRVLDFGIAKVIPADGAISVSHGLTNTGAILGTPYYMAPEQIFGERHIDQRADVWALGVMLYECLSGRRPTEAENVGQILKLITSNAIVPVRKLAPHLPADVAELVDHMLACDKAVRPSSLAGAHAILGQYAAGVTTQAFEAPGVTGPRSSGSSPDDSGRLIVRDVDASPTARTLASTTASTTADRIAGGVGPRRRGRLALGAGIAAVALAGAAMLLASTRTTTIDAKASAGGALPSAPLAPVAPAASSALTRSPAPPAVPTSTPNASAASPPPPAPSATSANGGSTPTARPHPGPAQPPHPGPSSTPDVLPKPSPYEHM